MAEEVHTTDRSLPRIGPPTLWRIVRRGRFAYWISGGEMGHAVLPFSGFYTGVHHRIYGVCRGEPGIRKAQRSTDWPIGGLGSLPPGLNL